MAAAQEIAVPVSPGIATQRVISALPAEPVERLRALFLGLSVVATVAVAARVLTSASPALTRGLAVAALLAMAVSWIVSYRQRNMPLPTLILDGLAIVAAGAALGGPVTIAGYLFIILALRSSYGDGLTWLWPTAVYGAALLVGQLLGPLYGGALNDPRVVQVPFVFSVGLVMRLLVTSLERQQQALVDERALSRAGSALVEAVDRQAILAAGLAAAQRLVGSTRRVELVESAGPTDSERLALPVSAYHGVHGQLFIAGKAPLPEHTREPLQALCTLIALRLEVDQHASRERELAEARAAELADLNRFKDELLDKVSHELRTPLTSIRSFSELLFSYQDPTVQTEFLHIINSESERLSRLVEDVLDLSKLQSGRLEWLMCPVDLASLLREAARVQQPLLELDSLELRLDIRPGLPAVMGDADRLLQVASNLLGNARKFTVKGFVSLAAWSEGKLVNVAVADTGMGVPEAERERIFDQFRQATPAPAGRPRGTGLGLSICREVIEHHGGRIWMEERADGGSVFRFTLPAIEAPAPVEPQTHGGPQSSSAHILKLR